MGLAARGGMSRRQRDNHGRLPDHKGIVFLYAACVSDTRKRRRDEQDRQIAPRRRHD